MAYIYATLFRENLKRSLEKRIDFVLNRIDSVDEQLYMLNHKSEKKQKVIVKEIPVASLEMVPIQPIEPEKIAKYFLYGCGAYICLRILLG